MDEQGMPVGNGRWRGCLLLMLLPVILLLGFCGWTKWHAPRNLLPPEVAWDEVVAFGGTAGLREGCVFGVYRITAGTKARFLTNRTLPRDWYRTPLHLKDGLHVQGGLDGRPVTLHADNANSTGCVSDAARQRNLGDSYVRARSADGNWYKIFNGGEGLILVAPREGLAWYLYFG